MFPFLKQSLVFTNTWQPCTKVTTTINMNAFASQAEPEAGEVLQVRRGGGPPRQGPRRHRGLHGGHLHPRQDPQDQAEGGDLRGPQVRQGKNLKLKLIYLFY